MPKVFSYVPVLANGIARNAAQSASPGLWHKLEALWCPSVGPQGNRLIDWSGRGRHGTGNNLAASVWERSPFGWALALDGTDDYFGTSWTHGYTHSTPFSVVAWINTTDSNRGIILGDFTSGTLGLNVEVSSTGKLRAFIATGVAKDYSGGTTINDGTWRMVAVTYDGAQGLKLYVNGAAESLTKTTDATLSGTIGSANPLRIGIDQRASPGTLYFGGKLGGVTVWRRTLLQREISDLWIGESPLELRRGGRGGVVPLSAVAINRAASWNVSGKVGPARSASWNVRAKVGPQRALSWNVRTKVGTSRGVAWGVRSKAAIARSASWNVRRLVSIARTASWNTQSNTSAVVLPTYEVTHGSRLLTMLAARLGKVLDELTVGEFATFRALLNRRLVSGWRQSEWPPLMRVELRRFRDDWSASTTYAAGAEVFHAGSNQYYQSLKAGNANHAPATFTGGAWVVDGSWWAGCRSELKAPGWVTGVSYALGAEVEYGNEHYQCHTAHTSSSVLTPDATGSNERWGNVKRLARSIGREQSGREVIDAFVGMFERNPRVTTRARLVDYSVLADDGAHVYEALAGIWVLYRVQCPVLRGNVFDSGAVYAAGDQVYFTMADGAGDWFNCTQATTAGQSPLTHGGKWVRVHLPDFLEGWMVRGAYADWLAQDGQHEKSEREADQAQQALVDAADVVYRQQGQVERVVTR